MTSWDRRHFPQAFAQGRVQSSSDPFVVKNVVNVSYITPQGGEGD
jgi:hypothetical protein